MKLKSGEYDGADIMKTWLLIETLEARLETMKNIDPKGYQFGMYVFRLQVENDSLKESLKRLTEELLKPHLT